LGIEDRKLSSFTYSPFEINDAGQKTHVLFHASRSSWIKVNDTGLDIAQLLDQNRSVQEATLYLEEKYGISGEVARHDVLLVRDELARNGFLKSEPTTRSSKSSTLNSLFFHITSRCNLVCPHCYVPCSDKAGKDDLQTSLVLRIIDEL